MDDLSQSDTDPSCVDPLGDRVMKSVPVPARYPLTRDQLWHVPCDSQDGQELPNMEVLRDHLKREGHIDKKELIELVTVATNIMRNEPNCVRMA